jgi:hypothetical protein
LKNLCWGTPVENAKDRDDHGMTRQGTEINTAKLSIAQVKEIRSLYSSGDYSMRNLAKKYSVTHKAIFQVIHAQSWKHVSIGE